MDVHVHVFDRIMKASLKIVLSTVYILIICPLGILYKAMGKDKLNLKQNTRPQTYWKK